MGLMGNHLLILLNKVLPPAPYTPTREGIEAIKNSIKKGIMSNRVTPDSITELKPNEVFCFGANLAGRHGAGAAKFAVSLGAVYGIGNGHAGQTYAIPTKDRQIKTLPLEKIAWYVNLFINYARLYSEKTFLVTQIGCGLAGYTPEQIAPLFEEAVSIDNIYLPESFWQVLNKK